jgi:addiction module RelE/StbE family toxin
MAEDVKIYTINVNKTAKNDLREIIKHISKNNPMNALNILKKIENKISTLHYFPENGRYVPELLKNNIKDFRQLTESTCRIIYKIDNNIINVLLIIKN